jgi:hypothetical protein
METLQMNEVKHSSPKSTKAKVAESFLEILQIAAYILGFFAFIYILNDVLPGSAAYGWGIAVGLMVLIGWALGARKE